MKRRHGQNDAAVEAALCQELIDEAAWIAVERYEEVLSAAECGERWCAGKHVALAHRDHEILIVKPPCLEAGRHRAQRQHRDVDLALFQLLQALLPGIVRRAWRAAPASGGSDRCRRAVPSC